MKHASVVSYILFAVAIITILITMIVRIPQGMMDALIAVNLAVSIVILLTAFCIRDATQLPSFPTILLLTTLFRVALNVSSTKLILLEADAGHIIYAFGNLMVGGNIVVGLVVFVVITIVQFIVITKGAERVAEVGARFVLDAMQGKQTSIENELRAGLPVEEAKAKRRELERESKLYGAMDGAMKFVKGDAIAGICISLVNIIGGLVIGVTQMHMTAAKAASVYTTLTIGDGLVSQIPSLLIGVSAGLVVTRVATGDEKSKSPSNAPSEIFQQFARQPLALAMAGGMMLVLALVSLTGVTGLPWWPFFFLGIGLISAVVARRVMEKNAQRDGQSQTEIKPIGDLNTFQPPFRLFLSRKLVAEILARCAANQVGFEELVNYQRVLIQGRLGIPLVPFELIPKEPIGDSEYGFDVYGTTVDQANVPLLNGKAFVVSSDYRRDPDALPLPWRRDVRMAKLIPREQAVLLDKNRFSVFYEPYEIILAHLGVIARRHAANLFGMQELSVLLEDYRKTFPELLSAIIPPLTLGSLHTILSTLLKEQVPLRNFRNVLESIARHVQMPSLNPFMIADYVRGDLGSDITSELIDTRLGALCYYELGGTESGAPIFEFDSARKVPFVSPTNVGRLLKALHEQLDWGSLHLVRPAICTLHEHRRLLRSYTEKSMPDLAILSVLERNTHLPQCPSTILLSDDASVVGARR